MRLCQRPGSQASVLRSRALHLPAGLRLRAYTRLSRAVSVAAARPPVPILWDLRDIPADRGVMNGARIIVPVRNGGARWREAVAALREALPDPSVVAVVDSGSTDGSDGVACEGGFEVARIDPRTFNHGGTRQMAVDRFCEG